MNLNENIAESEDIDDKIKNRLLKYYLCWFAKRGESTVSLVNYLFENRNDLAYRRELINNIGVGRHDQIASFLKDCLKNGFSSVAIGKFIEIHKSLFFDLQGKKFIVNVNGGQSYTIPAHQTDKNFAICRFLLLILDISQDKNFSNSVQKPTIDYILKLAENIADYKLRCRFKMAAISYFLPDDNEYIKSHLSSVMSDMKKLFAQELSDGNNEIEMECKFNIKHMILDMLTAKRNLVRKDITNFNVGKDSNFMRAFDPWTSPVEINGTKVMDEFARYNSYAYYHDCLLKDVLRRQINLLDGNFEDQCTQESSVIANDLNEIDESEVESETDNMPNFISDDIKNFKNPDGEINFVDDDADDIKKILLMWSDDNYPPEKRSDGLNSILDFVADDIKKLVDNKSKRFNWFTVFLFSDVRNLFSDGVLLKKIDELLEENEHNQNDYKIFTLVLVLLQNNNDGLHLLDVFSINEI